MRLRTYTLRDREFQERWDQILALGQEGLGRAPESILDVGCALGHFLAPEGCEPFDLVTMMDVVEHTEDPVAFLASAAGLLAPDGAVILQLPNRRSAMAQRAGSRWSWYSAPDHLIHLTPASVRTMASRARLRVKRLRTGDMLGDYALDVYPFIGRVELLLRRVPLGRRLHVRADGRGGLIQAVLVPAIR
jgi:SAM-dependent methyltransferase